MKQNRTVGICMIATMSIIGAACAKKKMAVSTPSLSPAPVAQKSPASAATPAPARTATTPPPSATPSSRQPNAATRARIDQLLARIEDAYFDYNKATLRPDALRSLQDDSAELRTILAEYPDYKLTIEGHADERGSAEYNLGLGDRRSTAAKEFLVQIGVPSPQLSVISYGKERPVCTERAEACWQKNRRIHIVADAKQ